VTEPTARTLEENRAAQTMRQINSKNKTKSLDRHSQNHKGMHAGNGRRALTVERKKIREQETKRAAELMQVGFSFSLVAVMRNQIRRLVCCLFLSKTRPHLDLKQQRR
jgi:hypothetical protein